MPKRVLVVDDEADIRLMLRKLLESRGWAVEEAHMGAQALQRGAEGNLDAIILDHRMPGILGSEVASGLRAQGFKGLIILYSGHLTPELAAQGSAMGFIAITKGDEGRMLQLLSELEGTEA